MINKKRDIKFVKYREYIRSAHSLSIGYNKLDKLDKLNLY